MFFKKKHSEFNDLKEDIDKLCQRIESMERIIQFHDHARITYANSLFGCYLYKDGKEYCIRGLRLDGNVKFLVQKNQDIDYVIMATCDIDSNNEEDRYQEQYIIDLNTANFIRTE